MNSEMAAASTPMAADDWWTTISLVVIAIGVVLALLVIWRGARLKRERKAVDDAIEARALETPAAAASIDTMPPPAPETDPVVTAPAVAPAPPPLAGDPTPVVATAPFDAAPATEAAAAAPTLAPAQPVAPIEASEPLYPAPPLPPVDSEPTASDGDDDLTQLKGVGPKLAAKLAKLGITRFAQIAALTATDAAALDARLGSFQGRMARDRWIEQASYLAQDDRAGFEAAFGKL